MTFDKSPSHKRLASAMATTHTISLLIPSYHARTTYQSSKSVDSIAGPGLSNGPYSTSCGLMSMWSWSVLMQPCLKTNQQHHACCA